MDILFISQVLICILLIVLLAASRKIMKQSDNISSLIKKINLSTYYLNQRSRDENQDEDQASDSEEPVAFENRDEREDHNRSVLFETLENMKCQPKIDEHNDIAVAYQGENFLFQFNGAFIRIWDLTWFGTKATDDKFTLLKDASNYANFSFGPTIIMHSPDEDGMIYISSRMDILFIPDLKEKESYVEALLDSFFSLKQNLQREIQRLKDNPRDRTMIDNPIGFDTATLSDPNSPQAN